MIDSQDGPPAWRQVAADLLRRVENGSLAEGSMLRAEVDLAHDYGVGERTVRQALRQLAADGFLYLRAGARAMVRHREVQVVVVPRGARLKFRHPKWREQRDMQLNASATVVEVTFGQRAPEVYEVLSTEIQTSA